MVRARTLGLGLLLVLQGCTYQQAMKRGGAAAASQDWERALQAYRFANELKPGRADEAMAQALDEAVRAELSAAEHAIGSKAFARAGEHLAQAERLDAAHPGIPPVREVALQAMVAELQARASAERADLRDTYAFGVLARRLHPTAHEVEDTTRALRERLIFEIDRLTREGEFEHAHALAAFIIEQEPEQATLSDTLTRRVVEAWVADFEERANSTRRRQPGLSAVYSVRAYEVGGEERHLDAARAALEAAAPGGTYRVFIDTRGDGARHWRVRKAVREGVEARPGVRRGWASTWDLQAVVAAPPERCAETREQTPHEKEYVSGTREVANPAFEEGERAVADAMAAAAEAEADREAQEAHRAALAAEVEALSAAFEERRVQRDQAKAALDETRSQLDSAKMRSVDLEAELEEVRAAGGGSEAIREAEMKVGVLEDLVAEWVEKVVSDEAKLAQAEAAYQAAQAELQPVKGKLAAQEQALTQATQRAAAAAEALAGLQQTQAQTAPTLTEDVRETLQYTETEWTLACEARSTLWFATRWKSQLDRQAVIEASASTTDIERPGHELAQVEADPKAYPRTREELIEEVDSTSHQGIIDAIEARLHEAYSLRIAAAFDEGADRDDATDTLLAVVAGAPERLDATARDQLAKHLSAHYGVEDPTLVGIEPLATE